MGPHSSSGPSMSRTEWPLLRSSPPTNPFRAHAGDIRGARRRFQPDHHDGDVLARILLDRSEEAQGSGSREQAGRQLLVKKKQKKRGLLRNERKKKKKKKKKKK